MQNGFIESFNGRLRDELLNETLFTSLHHARVALTSWQTDYNETRPHSRLGWQTPSAFAETFPRRDMALRNLTSFASCPVVATAHPDKFNQPNELRIG